MPETLLPIEIKTGYKCDENDTLRFSIQRAEKAALYLGSIFRLISLSALSVEMTDPIETAHFIDDLRHVSEIGEAVASSLFASIQPFESIACETDADGAPDNADSLALKLSDLLKTPNVPDELYNALIDGLENISQVSDHKHSAEYELSPERISHILNDYKEAKGDAKSH